MPRDGSTDCRSVTGEDVDDTWGEAGFGEEGADTYGGKGSEFGRLEDDGVAGCECGTNFPGHHEDYDQIKYSECG